MSSACAAREFPPPTGWNSKSSIACFFAMAQTCAPPPPPPPERSLPARLPGLCLNSSPAQNGAFAAISEREHRRRLKARRIDNLSRVARRKNEHFNAGSVLNRTLTAATL